MGDFRLLPLCGQDLIAEDFLKLSLRDDGLVLDEGCEGHWSPCSRNCDKQTVVCIPVVILDETETVNTVVTAGYFSSIVPRNQDEERC